MNRLTPALLHLINFKARALLTAVVAPLAAVLLLTVLLTHSAAIAAPKAPQDQATLFAAPVALPDFDQLVLFKSTTDAVAGDFNHDGWLDLVVTENAGNPSFICLNNHALQLIGDSAPQPD